MDFNFNINVQIGVTPQLATFLTALLESRPTAPTAPAQLPQTAAPTAPTVEAAQPAAAAEATAPASPEPQEYKNFVDGPTQAPAKELTEEDVRAAMHRTRQRFEGEDYKENTDSELYKKYHKQLTSAFKGIAALLGADKPSALPAEQRAQFIAECDALILDENGNVSAPPAPF